jgi:hypothetical protein
MMYRRKALPKREPTFREYSPRFTNPIRLPVFNVKFLESVPFTVIKPSSVLCSYSRSLKRMSAFARLLLSLFSTSCETEFKKYQMVDSSFLVLVRWPFVLVLRLIDSPEIY